MPLFWLSGFLRRHVWLGDGIEERRQSGPGAGHDVSHRWVEMTSVTPYPLSPGMFARSQYAKCVLYVGWVMTSCWGGAVARSFQENSQNTNSRAPGLVGCGSVGISKHGDFR